MTGEERQRRWRLVLGAGEEGQQGGQGQGQPQPGGASPAQSPALSPPAKTSSR